ncbi:hypothetical protein GCM10009799_22480 [Nocardiopsis rhodophaea]|uniref:Integral membrane protein n=1 Tax=Nocardiopsis rhodophaea TaxID=280238 RepID=A0ABN2T0N3_9ACTN
MSDAEDARPQSSDEGGSGPGKGGSGVAESAGSVAPLLKADTSPITVALEVVQSAFRSLAAAVLLPLLPLGLVITLVTLLWARDGSAVVNSELVLIRSVEDLPPPLLFLGLLLISIGVLYGLSVSYTASLQVAAGALLRRPVSARAALRRAAVRPWAMLLALIMLLVNVVIALAAFQYAALYIDPPVSDFFDAEEPLPFSLVVPLLVLLPAVHLTFAAVSSALEGLNPLRAVRRARALLRGNFAEPTLDLALVLLLAGALNWLWPRALKFTGLTGIAQFALGGVIQVLAAMCVSVFLAGLLTVLALPAGVSADRRAADGRPVGLEAVLRRLPDADERRPRRHRDTLLGVTAAMVSVLLLPGTLWAAPTLMPTYTAQMGMLNEGTATNPGGAIGLWVGESGVLLRGAQESTTAWCDPNCRAVGTEADGISETSEFVVADSASGADAELVHVRWEHRDESRLLVSRVCQGRGIACGDQATTTLRSHETDLLYRASKDEQARHYGPAAVRFVAAQGTEDGITVASLAALPDAAAFDVQIHRCADALCREHTATSVGKVPLFHQPEGYNLTGHPVDLAVRPDKSAVISVYDPFDGSVTLLSCSDPDCSESTQRTLKPARYVRSEDGEFPGKSLVSGSRIEVRPNGRPVIAYRDPSDGSSRILDCQDVRCSETEERDLTGPGTQRPLPGLAVDGEGRPQLVTTDAEGKELILISCEDTECADTRTVPLLPDGESLFLDVALGLDGQDRPVIAADYLANRPGVAILEEDGPILIRCDRPACGATG